MSEKDLREILESSNDKLSVFADRDTLASCDNLTEKDLISLIDNYLMIAKSWIYSILNILENYVDKYELILQCLFLIVI